MDKTAIYLANVLLMGSLVACGSSRKAKKQAGAAPVAAAPAPRKMASSCSDEGKTANVRESDVDGDARPDLFKYYNDVDDPDRPGERKTILVRQDIDLNWDGHLDICRFFAVDGTVAREEFDLDYDGRIDEVRTYEAGVITLSERDRNNDGRFDVIRRYKNGKLIQKEVDTNDDGNIDRWEYYSGKSLDRIGIDLDHDGKVDRWAKSSR